MKIKKFAAILLSVLLAFALCVPAFAATGTDAKITISNPNSNITIDGKTFYAYRLFDLNYNSTDDAYAYTVNNAFTAFFQNEIPSTDTGAALDVAAYAHISALSSDSKNLLDFADHAYNWATDSSHPISAVTSETASNESVTLNVGAFGYYLVYGEALDEDNNIVVSDYMCVTCNSDTVATAIDIKADAPTVDKDVSTDGTNYNDLAVDAGLGSTVYFKYESTVPDMYGYDAYTFIFNDTLSEGLTFGSITSVMIGGTALTLDNDPTPAADTYSFSNSTNDTTGITTLTLSINNLLAYAEGAAVVVKYTATVNSDGLTVSNNKVDIEYSNNPNDDTTNHTPDSEVHVYNYQIPVYKYTTKDEVSKALAGAKFELTVDGQSSPLSFVYDATNEWYRLAIGSEAGATTTLVSDADGNIDIRGLDAATYILKETEAPEGYNLLTDTITVTITAPSVPDGSCTITSKYTSSEETASVVSKINVQNTTGVVLPSTGGIGTTMFKIGGILIILLAGAFLVINRKKVFGSGK